MEINKKKVGRIDVVSLKGRMDAYNSISVSEFLDELTGEGSKQLLIEMEGVDYMSSSGLRVLLSTLKKLKNQGGKLKLCSLQPYVQEVFEIAGFNQLFDIYSSEDEALKSFS